MNQYSAAVLEAAHLYFYKEMTIDVIIPMSYDECLTAVVKETWPYVMESAPFPIEILRLLK